MKQLYLLLLLHISCSDQLIQTTELNNSSLFQLSETIDVPSLTGSSKANAFYSSSEITYTKNLFIGLGDINSKTFFVNNNPFYSDETNEWPYRNDGNFQIFIDTTQFLTIDEYRLPDDFYETLLPEDYFGSAFQKKLDQYPLDKYKSLPVFILNKSSSYNTIVIEDGRFAMIYEAKDYNGNWKPIEFKTYSWCGNSYSNFNIRKDQFALFKVPEQTGDFKTRLRLKARIGKQIFYSNEISGLINLSQFEFSQNRESPYDWHYILDPENTSSLFLDE